MFGLSVVGLAGSTSGDRRLYAAVQHVVSAATLAARSGSATVLDYAAFDREVRSARYRMELDAAIRQALGLIERSDALVIGLPFERGSIPGAFKHLFDLSDPEALRGKPVLAVAHLRAEAEEAALRRHAALFLEAIGVDLADDLLLIGRDDVGADGTLEPASRGRFREAAAVLAARGAGIGARHPARKAELPLLRVAG